MFIISVDIIRWYEVRTSLRFLFAVVAVEIPERHRVRIYRGIRNATGSRFCLYDFGVAIGKLVYVTPRQLIEDYSNFRTEVRKQNEGCIYFCNLSLVVTIVDENGYIMKRIRSLKYLINVKRRYVCIMQDKKLWNRRKVNY